MGLLDDAIREHLDLKRRRGADPAEISRLEQEALGPVRREPVQAEAAEQAPEPAAEPAAEAQPEREPAEAQSADEGLPPDDSTHVVPPSERHEGPHGDPLAERPHEDRPPPDPQDVVLQPTTEFRVEDHHDDEDDRPGAGGPTAAAEDVLEETPDFLQETPEHDRLWFEQRPPRDFDFDG